MLLILHLSRVTHALLIRFVCKFKYFFFNPLDSMLVCTGPGCLHQWALASSRGLEWLPYKLIPDSIAMPAAIAVLVIFLSFFFFFLSCHCSALFCLLRCPSNNQVSMSTMLTQHRSTIRVSLFTTTIRIVTSPSNEVLLKPIY